MPPVSSAEIWQRLEWFLSQIVPVAEAAGVKLALHPEDPPADSLRGGARLVNQPHKYQRVIDLAPSTSNALEFCLGSLQEMSEGDVYEAIEQYGRQDRIAYVHFRNVRGKVPLYQEVFVDEGDLDMIRAVRERVSVPLIASGGAGAPEHFPPAVAAGADAVLAASVFHFGPVGAIAHVKDALRAAGYEVR